MSEVLQKYSRMPRKYEAQAPKPPALSNLQGQLAPLKDVDHNQVIQRYLADERSADIAGSLGVTRSGLNQWLLRVCEDDWKEAQVARAITRKEDAEDALEDAADPLSLARARERLKAAQWDLERVCRRIYGQEEYRAVVITPVLNIMVSGSGATNAVHQVLEADVVSKEAA